MSEHSAPRTRMPFRWRLAAVLTLLLTVLSSAAASPATSEPAHGSRHRDLRPVIFVHGGAGSGAQFETQAQRLTSNGYPTRLIHVLEYDSTFGLNTMEDVWARLDALIASTLQGSRADQVDLLGHSLGTTVSHGYLNSSPERAARIAHYVNIDGRTADAPPGGVDTLAVWGEGAQTRQIIGAQNYYAPDQSHVQVATSEETFAQFYEFFTGRRPRTTNVVPERGLVRLSGEANLFPSNVGATHATLQIWEVNGRTGERRGHRPKATFDIGEDGAWGPFRASSRRHYEFALVSETTGTTHHFYFQPFRRSDHLIRLLTSEPGTGLDLLREKSDRHSTVTVVRYKEWWGDQGALNDVLEVDGLNVLNAANSPRTKRVNAIFLMDMGSDGVTDLTAPHPVIFSLPFLTGMDVFIPATTPPNRAVRVEMTARASDRRSAVINVPNWASSQHHMTVQFPDS